MINGSDTYRWTSLPLVSNKLLELQVTDGFVPIGILSVAVDKKIYYYMSVTLSVFLDLDASMFVLDASIEDSIQFDELVTTGDIPKALGATYDHP